jgi:hypothetical protein
MKPRDVIAAREGAEDLAAPGEESTSPRECGALVYVLAALWP